MNMIEFVKRTPNREEASESGDGRDEVD